MQLLYYELLARRIVSSRLENFALCIENIHCLLPSRFLLVDGFLAIQIETKDQSQLESPTRFCTTSLQVAVFRSHHKEVTPCHFRSQFDRTFVIENWVVVLDKEFLH